MLVVSALSLVGASGQVQIDETRTTLEKWVETRKQTAMLKADWTAEKETLEASIGLFESELTRLDASIKEVKEGKGGDTEIAKQMKEQEELDQELQNLEAHTKELLAKLETALKKVVKSLPAPLSKRIEPYINKIPEDPENTKAPITMRAQLITATLTEINKFNSEITVASEIRENQGLELQVTTIYLGLAQAYFSDANGTYAGVGKPTADGWVWTSEPALGPDILQAAKIYEKQAPAGYVNLPVTVE